MATRLDSATACPRVLGIVSIHSACAIACVAAMAGGARAQCDPATVFGFPLSFSAQSVNGVTIVNADFNEDGIQDIATESDTGVGFISVLLGDGSGGFGVRTLFATNQSRPFGLSAGDVNGDGHIDLVSGNSQGTNVVILLGNGDGTFQAAQTVSVPTSSSTETGLGDFNGDGDLDLIVSDPGNDRVWYLRGLGDGTFAAGAELSTGDFPNHFSINDIDGDGALDIIVGNSGSPNDISVIRGNGLGQFFTQVRFAVGSDPTRPVVADLNADGRKDIVVANIGGNNVSVLLATGLLTFAPQVVYGVGDGPRHVRIADVTGDGVPDLLVANGGSDNVSLRPGVGDGTFGPQVTFGVNDRPEDGALFDANGDGELDFVVVHSTSQAVTPLLNSCSPGLRILSEPQDTIASTGGPATFTVQAAGPGTLAYQWFFEGSPVGNGPGVSGATSATLTIDPASYAASGAYSVRVSVGLQQVFSDPAQLGVIATCLGDFNADGSLNSSDFLEFLNAFSLGCN